MKILRKINLDRSNTKKAKGKNSKQIPFTFETAKGMNCFPNNFIGIYG